MELPAESLLLKEIILNTSKPLVIRNFKHKWSAFNGTLLEWCNKFDKAKHQEKTTFDQMPRLNNHLPQFERRREQISLRATEFLNKYSEHAMYWTGLNYVDSKLIPEECRKDVNFDQFGFPKSKNDYTFWLSGRGSNTPCHMDTYGCNIVVQLYGRKSWLLFPPHAPLKDVRIPYEESSVYCSNNFYSPNKEQIEELQQLENHVYHCVLEPNSVLIVPNHWWHYVEAIEPSLSLNCWIPLDIDIDAQVEECILKYLIENIVKSTHCEQITKYVLNPNQIDQISTRDEIFNICKHLLQLKFQNRPTISLVSNDIILIDNEKHPYRYMEDSVLKYRMQNISGLEEVPKMSKENYQKFLINNGKRFQKAENNVDVESPLDTIQEILINSICSSKVLKSISQELYNRYQRLQLGDKPTQV